MTKIEVLARFKDRRFVDRPLVGRKPDDQGVVTDLADANPEAAETSFEQARGRFLGSEPLVRVTLENGDLRGEVTRRALPSQIRPDTLHLMTWDSDDERIVRVQIPLSLWRILDDGSMGDLVGDLDLSVEDIDHHGPGLILDHQDARRQRVLLWAE